MDVFGHRGAAGHVAENTLAALKLGCELGAHGVEFDVRLTRDGVPVLLHDATLQRTTGAADRLADLDADQLAAQRTPCGQRVPTLALALSILPPPVRINVELKECSAATPAVRVLQQAVEASLIEPRQLLISAFDPQALRVVRAAAPEWAIGALSRQPPSTKDWQFCREIHAVSLHLEEGVVTESVVHEVHDRGLRLFVFTVNDPQRGAELARWGVDAVFSDVPDRLLGVADIEPESTR